MAALKEPPSRLLLVGNGEPLAALGPTALQHQPTLVGRHTRPEPVPLGTAGRIGLKRALALLGSSHLSPPPPQRSCYGGPVRSLTWSSGMQAKAGRCRTPDYIRLSRQRGACWREIRAGRPLS